MMDVPRVKVMLNNLQHVFDVSCMCLRFVLPGLCMIKTRARADQQHASDSGARVGACRLN